MTRNLHGLEYGVYHELFQTVTSVNKIFIFGYPPSFFASFLLSEKPENAMNLTIQKLDFMVPGSMYLTCSETRYIIDSEIEQRWRNA